MQARDIRSVADLGGEAAGVVTTLLRDMHAGLVSRVFGAVGPAAKPTQIIHDAAAGLSMAVWTAGFGGQPV